jgi:hypothetical protein
MERNDKKGEKTECRRYHRYASLPQTDMYETVGEGCQGVSGEWRQKDERDNGVSKIVMGFKLRVVVRYFLSS